MSRLLILGDIHGAARAVEQVFERANFDPSSDRLIFIGDICDGWSETPRAIDLINAIPNKIIIIGNHDEWFKEWIDCGVCVPEWWHQGGKATVQAYDPRIESFMQASHAQYLVPKQHNEFFAEAVLYHVEDNMAFTHGGFGSVQADIPPAGGYSWDRMMWMAAQTENILDFDRIFIGHTATEPYSLEPVKRHNVWNLDQGAGWNGKLTLMDAYTEEYWQSDLVSDLYPDELGRRT